MLWHYIATAATASTASTTRLLQLGVLDSGTDLDRLKQLGLFGLLISILYTF